LGCWKLPSPFHSAKHYTIWTSDRGFNIRKRRVIHCGNSLKNIDKPLKKKKISSML